MQLLDAEGVDRLLDGVGYADHGYEGHDRFVDAVHAPVGDEEIRLVQNGQLGHKLGNGEVGGDWFQISRID